MVFNQFQFISTSVYRVFSVQQNRKMFCNFTAEIFLLFCFHGGPLKINNKKSAHLRHLFVIRFTLLLFVFGLFYNHREKCCG